MRPVLPQPHGDDWREFASDLVSALRRTDLWQHTHAKINGVLEDGSSTFFVEATAPAGWKDVSGGLGDRLLRTAATGGGTGGSWTLSGVAVKEHTLIVGELPVHQHGLAVDAVAAHVHAYEYPSASHQHSATTSIDSHTHALASQTNPGTHTHIGFADTSGGTPTGPPDVAVNTRRDATLNTSTDGAHAHTLSTVAAADHVHLIQTDVTANHTHSLSLASAPQHKHSITCSTWGGGGGHGHSFTTNASWRPAYLDVILCERITEVSEPPPPILPVTEGPWDRWTLAFTSSARLSFKALAEWLEGRTARLAPRGAHMVFVQAAPPAGWKQDPTVNDRVLRMSAVGGGGTGGSWFFSGVATDLHILTEAEIPPHAHPASMSAAGAHAHAVAMSADGSHGHSFTSSSAGAHSHSGMSSVDGGHSHGMGMGANVTTDTHVRQSQSVNATPRSSTLFPAGTHTHSLSLAGIQHTHAYLLNLVADHTHGFTISVYSHAHTISVQAIGGGLGHSHSMTSTGSWRPAYIDCIVATRV